MLQKDLAGTVQAVGLGVIIRIAGVCMDRDGVLSTDTAGEMCIRDRDTALPPRPLLYQPGESGPGEFKKDHQLRPGGLSGGGLDGGRPGHGPHRRPDEADQELSLIHI